MGTRGVISSREEVPPACTCNSTLDYRHWGLEPFPVLSYGFISILFFSLSLSLSLFFFSSFTTFHIQCYFMNYFPVFNLLFMHTNSMSVAAMVPGMIRFRMNKTMHARITVLLPCMLFQYPCYSSGIFSALNHVRCIQSR